jgi:glycosyltransferase involved in cell wall biosynthesis
VSDSPQAPLPGRAIAVRQRLCIVLPTSGAFDSRSQRIADSMVERGHEVTIIARRASGLPNDETMPEGWRIVRVPVSAVDGLPVPRIIRTAIANRRNRASGRSNAAAGPRTSAIRQGSRRGAPGRAIRSVWRMVAIGLTVRSQIGQARLVAPNADIYHGMAYMGVPVALALGRRQAVNAVIYDARDIYVDAHNLARLPRPARALLGRVERRWARRANRVVTVNQGYAEVMAARWGMRLPLVVMNCSDARLAPRDRRFHDRFGLSAETAVVLYHGGLSPERGIEQLIAAMAQLPRCVLVLMGYGALESRLPAMIAEHGLADRVRLLPPVPPGELLDWVAAADIAAMPIQASTLNHRLTTPNKLFEAMAAGVPVVASDLPGMSRIIAETGCGLTCDPADPSSIAAAIRRIVDDPTAAKRMGAAGLAAASGTYSWTGQVEKLAAEYTSLTGPAW